MSLNAAAQHLAQHGRGNDSMLVHMSPKEVKSLQELAMAHGGSLSVNPSTGLPEAGFLDSLLPTLLGVGITAATGGAAAPWMVGLGVGGFEALRTGDLGKGLMAGLGAYGGAGTMGGFMGAGAAPEAMQAAQSNIDPAALEGMSKAQVAATIPESNPFSLAAQGVKNTFANPQGISVGLSNFAQGMGGTKAALGTAAAAAAPALFGGGEYTPPPMATSTENPTYKYHPGTTTPMPQPDVPSYTNSTKPRGSQSGMSENFGRERKYYSPSYEFTGMKTIPTTTQQPKEEDKGLLGLGFLGLAEGGSYAYDPKTQTYKTIAVETPTITGQAKEQLMTETGGLPSTPNANHATPAQNQALNDALTAAVSNLSIMGMISNIANSLDSSAVGPTGAASVSGAANEGSHAADGNSGVTSGGEDAGIGSGAAIGEGGELARGGEIRGISHLGSYSDGGRLLRGPGDGVSDDIPAVIGKKQPARLADGEFVVPARIVSELGNGSTEAGARKLYAMMDRIQAGRKKTMGKRKQFAKDSKADRHLPA